ncbi:protein dead ringer-like protein [Leptotrombidium deliense]|uniref:Protein dead ringer-like protein n=1 Tax=Leptotrombidium deliense TaxID=299467 RepID=A0A443SUR8_9ACAR|nr:protein dead ringer-like protein [Leptotrombidium deliense]
MIVLNLENFVGKTGTPVNRIPIMAKQVLDLYELYRLVVARGGLVEVINKKIWREITKGLNLPSSITSAAFTLRTQYMKYLYPYECEKERLSTPEELQQAIDGNRREGRRSSYGHYGDIMGATPPPTSTGISRNHTPSHHNSPISLVSRHINGHSSQGASSGTHIFHIFKFY